jgi:hypothetical protein
MLRTCGPPRLASIEKSCPSATRDPTDFFGGRQLEFLPELI